jgi:phage-related protein (TIGR01555 family)
MLPVDNAPLHSVSTADSIINAAARLGLGTDTLASGANYAYSTVSRNRQNLDNSYRGSWLVGVAVDSVADDMTRAGIEFVGDIDPHITEAIQQTFARTGTWQGLADTIRWGRLYGGAIGVILLDGQDPSSELRPDRVRKDQYKGLLVLDRWMVTPSLEDVITDFGPEMGLPRYYRLNAGQNTGSPTPPGTKGAGVNTFATGGPSMGNAPGIPIHYSRCIRMDGATLPFFARQGEMGWGQSIVERLYDRLLAYDSATQGAAQLVYKAHLRTLKVNKLREAIAFGGKALDGLVAQIDLIRRFQSNDGLTLLDGEDEFGTHQYTFGGLPELLHQFSEQLSGALQIPVVRLFGQSPAGFSTGEADLQNYYDSISTQQEARLRRPLTPLLEVICPQRYGQGAAGRDVVQVRAAVADDVRREGRRRDQGDDRGDERRVGRVGQPEGGVAGAEAVELRDRHLQQYLAGGH